MKFKLTIAYDGTNYAGWQVQKIGLGVQQRVEEALQRFFPGVKRVHSSSRTDTGVHALGMVVHVEIPKEEFKMPIARFGLAINAFLPEDIRIMAVSHCPEKFHARFDASGKQYRYFVWNHYAMNPLLRGRAWHVGPALNLRRMRDAAKLFLGKHDFQSFAASREYKMDSTVRTLHRCDIKKNGDLLTFIIEGDGFLYKMCRGIAGTLVYVGQGKIALSDVKKIVAAKDRNAAGMTAPAHGLVLWKVFYKKKTKDNTDATDE
ncbi:MAG: tRNA pseudouridine synthase [Verrucomicrobiales bacterium]|nr:tRNA pseudouridine synthase [Verrucomicrobiales bacterium]